MYVYALHTSRRGSRSAQNATILSGWIMSSMIPYIPVHFTGCSNYQVCKLRSHNAMSIDLFHMSCDRSVI